jgi:hypothetical protein
MIYGILLMLHGNCGMIFTIDDKKKIYLITGLINTIFGYFIGILKLYIVL